MKRSKTNRRFRGEYLPSWMAELKKLIHESVKQSEEREKKFVLYYDEFDGGREFANIWYKGE